MNKPNLRTGEGMPGRRLKFQLDGFFKGEPLYILEECFSEAIISSSQMWQNMDEYIDVVLNDLHLIRPEQKAALQLIHEFMARDIIRAICKHDIYFFASHYLEYKGEHVLYINDKEVYAKDVKLIHSLVFNLGYKSYSEIKKYIGQTMLHSLIPAWMMEDGYVYEVFDTSLVRNG